MNETMPIYLNYWYKKIININHILFNPTHLIFFFFFAPFDVYPKLEKMRFISERNKWFYA